MRILFFAISMVLNLGSLIPAAEVAAPEKKREPEAYQTWPFDDAEAKRRQKETAERLGVTVESSLDIGNGAKLELVLVPAGRFMMGSPETENGRYTNEVLHEVTLTKPYWMGKCEVTVGQFRCFVEETAFKTEAEQGDGGEGWTEKGLENRASFNWRTLGFEQGDTHPVVDVSWNDAQAYCRWLSQKVARDVRLPTEAEWEYGARGGTRTAYVWGEDGNNGKGWGNASDLTAKGKFRSWETFAWSDGYVFTAPTGRFRANAFGLCDTMGNVWEWCGDLYGEYEKGAQCDPTGATSGDKRVFRGGSWNCKMRSYRSAFRNWQIPGYRDSNKGFRVVVVGIDLKSAQKTELQTPSQGAVAAKSTDGTASETTEVAPKDASLDLKGPPLPPGEYYVQGKGLDGAVFKLVEDNGSVLTLESSTGQKRFVEKRNIKRIYRPDALKKEVEDRLAALDLQSNDKVEEFVSWAKSNDQNSAIGDVLSRLKTTRPAYATELQQRLDTQALADRKAALKKQQELGDANRKMKIAQIRAQLEDAEGEYDRQWNKDPLEMYSDKVARTVKIRAKINDLKAQLISVAGASSGLVRYGANIIPVEEVQKLKDKGYYPTPREACEFVIKTLRERGTVQSAEYSSEMGGENVGGVRVTYQMEYISKDNARRSGKYSFVCRQIAGSGLWNVDNHFPER